MHITNEKLTPFLQRRIQVSRRRVPEAHRAVIFSCILFFDTCLGTEFLQIRRLHNQENMTRRSALFNSFSGQIMIE